MPYGKGFIMPNVPDDVPAGLKKILSATYSSVRQKWTEEHPNDKENEENKKSAASIAWSQVKKEYKKNKEGKWVEKDEKEKLNKDSSYCHEVIVKDPDDFEGGTFKDFSDNNIEGVYGKKAQLKGSSAYDTQSLMFSTSQFTIGQVKDYLDKNKISYKKIIQANEDEVESIDFTKTDMMEYKTIQHFDILDETVVNLSSKMVSRSDGTITGKPIVTNIGVFVYKNPDGTITRELRPPEEVFKDESLDSLKSIPVTNSHPDPKKHKDGLVNNQNRKDLQVGMTGNDVEHDAYAVSVSLTIDDKDAVSDVRSGKDMLSCGYRADLDFTPGNFLGVPYDAVQRNIRYNHVATVKKARAGDLAKMRFDGGDSILTEVAVSDVNNIKEGEIMKKISIDGVEYEAEAKVIESLTKYKSDSESLSKENSELKTKLSTAEAQRDSFKDEADKAKKELEGNVITDEMINSAVQERIAIVSVANELKVETKKDGIDLNNDSLKKAIIIKKYPSAKLDGKDNVYVNARYDALLDSIKDENSVNNKKKVFGDNVPSSQNKQDSQESNAHLSRKDAYDKQAKELENRSVTYKSSAMRQD